MFSSGVCSSSISIAVFPVDARGLSSKKATPVSHEAFESLF